MFVDICHFSLLGRLELIRYLLVAFALDSADHACTCRMQEQHRAQLEQQALQAQLLADRAGQEAELRNQQQTYQVLSPRRSRTIDDDAATVVSMRSSASKATVGWETRGRRSSKQSPDKAEKKRRQKEAMTALERKEKELLGKLK